MRKPELISDQTLVFNGVFRITGKVLGGFDEFGTYPCSKAQAKADCQEMLTRNE